MTQIRSHRIAPLTFLLCAALAGACSKNPEPTPTAAPTSAPTQATPKMPTGHPSVSQQTPGMGMQQQQGGAELAWDAPAGWESAPNPSAMRKATYKIKRAEGDTDDAELSISQAGGSVDANVQRWVGQFETSGADAVKKSERTVNDLKVSVVEIHGTFKGSGMPGMPATGPKSTHAMLGAVVEVPGGGLWFFKLTGPDKTVTAAKGDFDKFLESLRIKK